MNNRGGCSPEIPDEYENPASAGWQVRDFSSEIPERTLLSGGVPTVGWTDASSGSFPVLVSRATAAGGPYESVAGLAAGTTSWTDATAALGVRYYYIVQ